MSIEENTFPQAGDPDDAARFAQMIGHQSLVDYVDHGLDITPDFESGDVVVSEGVFYTSAEIDVASSDGDEIHTVGYVSQVPETTLSLPDSGEKYVVADSNLDSTNSPKVILEDSITDLTDGSFVIGHISIDEESVTEMNRLPSASFNELSADGVMTIPEAKEGDEAPSPTSIAIDPEEGVLLVPEPDSGDLE